MIEFVNNRTLIAGEGALEKAVKQLAASGKSRAFVAVYDSAAPYVAHLLNLLSENGITCTLYDKINSEPCLAMIDAGTRLCLDNSCDCVVAVGGGSVIDTAKLVALLATNGGSCEDYQLNAKSPHTQPLFFMAVPTTAGTGAEATKVSVVYNENRGYKKSVYDNSMIAQLVALDPEATSNLPPRIAAATGMDAIIHAVESYVSTGANTISKMYSLSALSLLMRNIEQVCGTSNAAVRTDMMIGSYLAGLALSAGAGLAHIVGQPIGAVYHIPHGEACSAFFLDTLRTNKNYARSGFVEIAKTIGVDTAGRGYDEVFADMLCVFEGVMERVHAPRKLCECMEIESFDIDFAVRNISECMSHIKSNPKPTDENVYRELIIAAMK